MGIFKVIDKSNNLSSLDNFIINSVLKTNKDKITQQKKLLKIDQLEKIFLQ